jgi:hypothetical protein
VFEEGPIRSPVYSLFALAKIAEKRKIRVVVAPTILHDNVWSSAKLLFFHPERGYLVSKPLTQP